MRGLSLHCGSALVAVAVFFGHVTLACAGDATTQPAAKPAAGEQTIRISGKLLTKDNKPVEKVKVYLCHKKAGIVVLDVSKDEKGMKIDDPSGTTGASGEFVISAPTAFIDKAPQHIGMKAQDDEKNTFTPGFTLAVIVPEAPGEFKILRDRDGKLCWFKLDKTLPAIDLKSFLATDASYPSTWIFRYPDGDLKAGGVIVFDHSQ